MKNKNMCKFIESSVSENLKTENFVFETEIMETPHAITLHRAILIARGEGVFQIDQISLPFHTGTLCFVFQGERYSVKAESSCEYIYITFGGGRAEELFRRFGIHKGNRSVNGLDSLLPLWRESLLHASAENIDLAAESMLLYTFSRLQKSCHEKDDLIQKITAFSEENFNDPTLALSFIAEKLNYNAKYLSHTFKEKTGTSYTEYLRMLRLKYAISLFDHGLDSIKNVALLSGFSDPLYFSTIFKQTLGVSPKEYLERIQNI